MANQQTRALQKRGLSLKFNRGVDFSHLGSRDRSSWPEFTLVERPSSKGKAVDSSFGNREKTNNTRTKAYHAPVNPLGRDLPVIKLGFY